MHYALTSVAKYSSKYNQWRVESLHNPIWSVSGNLTLAHKQRKFDHQFTLHMSHKFRSDISLNEVEKKTFQLLKEMQKEEDCPVAKAQPRCAGGWIRDKCLGMESNDIDFALDICDGETYGQCVINYQTKIGLETHSMGVIASNPEQSKHLRTATTHIFGNPVDFVNLRSEEYADNSRIPQVKFGTAKEDALRRDLTINALFYNIITEEIEDFTGLGVSDLKQGIIRTPIDAVQTFLDDPLRVIRAVRLASKFHFIVLDDIFEAARLKSVHLALREKISRERVGTELMKILKSNDPVGAFALFHELNIIDCVFNISSVQVKKGKIRPYENPIPLLWNEDQFNNALFRVRRVFLYSRKFNFTSDIHVPLIIAAFLSPIVSHLSNDEIIDLGDNLICTSFKLPKKVSALTTRILISSKEIAPFIKTNCTSIHALQSFYDSQFKSHRLSIGLWSRRSQDIFHPASILACLWNTKSDEFEENIYIEKKLPGEVFAHAIQSSIMKEIMEMSLLLNGNEIMKLYNQKSGGKFVRDAMEHLETWQIQQWPTDKSRATEYILSKKNDLLQ